MKRTPIAPTPGIVLKKTGPDTWTHGAYTVTRHRYVAPSASIGYQVRGPGFQRYYRQGHAACDTLAEARWEIKDMVDWLAREKARG